MYYTWVARRNAILIWGSIQAGLVGLVVSQNPSLRPAFARPSTLQTTSFAAAH
ncbi:hypothetical protein CYLTODRAFT_421129 [Cylindrobasidium torrendii FP15055 ss-10]|uniref:HIG1 domain-containing protein n=1 Tax=Cylindrobasidium torrendii FP15055 ss-10 TaxID=1314674 RepID=A0A0D7BFL7_9AGAR|nr:hypothetical protein CYLTODRAFT_421129 [Cylindrobasidium torrendii FP15055 ss-10]